MKSKPRDSQTDGKGLISALRATLVIGTGALTILIGALFSQLTVAPATAVPGDIIDLTLSAPAGGQVSLPLAGSYSGLSVVWGDGVTNTSLTHTYSAAGSYSLRVIATATGPLSFGSLNQTGWTGVGYVTAVTEWSSLTSLEGAFSHATNLTSVPNFIPTTVANAHYMFWHADTFNSPNVVSWNTSNITNMARMFADCPVFNQPIGGWNTSAVTDMESMFVRDVMFNQDLNTWDVSHVTSMRYMFEDAVRFNGNISSWNTSSVTLMASMFAGTSDASPMIFNRDIGGWNTSRVTDMNSMFLRAINFNQNLNNWDVSQVTDMNYMFQDAAAFNGNISSWNTGRVTSMAVMFGSNSDSRPMAFNQPIGGWNTSSLTNANSMFLRARSFNQNLNNWNVSRVTDMRYMFQNASAFNGNISSWDTSSVSFMTAMFFGASSFNQDIGAWDVSHVTDMMYMFMRATSFNQNLNGWNTHSVTNISRMFELAPAFNSPLNNWDTSNVTTTFRMFADSTSFNQPLNNWNTANVTNMELMFIRATEFNQPLASWDTGNVTSMRKMFQDADSFNQPIGNWNTSNVTNMSEMFALEEPGGTISFNQPIGNWDTSSVVDMSYMFYGSTSFNQPIGNWDTSSVTDFTGVFEEATAFNQSISTWNTSAAPPSHLVNYALGGGLGTLPVPAVIANTDTFTVGSGSQIGRTDYRFAGWSDGTHVYQPGSTYPATAVSVTLTAQWTLIPTTRITFDGNGAAGSARNFVVYTGSRLSISGSYGFERYGYSFTGWSDGTKTYAPGAEIVASASDITLTAQWTELLTVPNAPSKPSAVLRGTTAIVSIARSALDNATTKAASSIVVTASNGSSCSVPAGASSCEITALKAGSKVTFTAVASTASGSSQQSEKSDSLRVEWSPLPAEALTLKFAPNSGALNDVSQRALANFVATMRTYEGLNDVSWTITAVTRTAGGRALATSDIALIKQRVAGISRVAKLPGLSGDNSLSLVAKREASPKQYDYIRITPVLSTN
jgi:surface protein